MPTWNPFIKAISGEPKTGSRLSVHIVPPGKSGMWFKPTVIAVRPEHELRWLGHLMVPGIFDGEHYFLLDPIGDDRTALPTAKNSQASLFRYLEALFPQQKRVSIP